MNRKRIGRRIPRRRWEGREVEAEDVFFFLLSRQSIAHWKAMVLGSLATAGSGQIWNWLGEA
jgi:hypothetical protein